MRTFFTLLLLAAVLPISSDLRAQSAADPVRLEALSREFAEWFEAHRTPLYYDLLRSETEISRSTGKAPQYKLMYIHSTGRPVFYTTSNLDAAKTTSTDDLWPGGWTGLGLTGSPIQTNEVVMWDNGIVRGSHQELTGRVTWSDTNPSATMQDHATHVAGTIIASGVVPQARGAAYQGRVTAYEFTNDLAEMAVEAAGVMRVSNHSYGLGAGWFGPWAPCPTCASLWTWFGDRSISTTEDAFFGYYDSLTMNLDLLAASAPNYTIVVAAGNERGEGPASGTLHWHWDPANPSAVNGFVQSTDSHPVDGGTSGYDCATGYALAKNVITIGAVHDMNGPCCATSSTLAPFSSFGPTDDGRVKPDLVANGVALYTPGAGADNAYLSASGTSLAAPSATGSIALVRRYYRQTHASADPRASTVRAILVQTAADDLTWPGPDYAFGWGVLDAASACFFVREDSTNGGRIFEDALANGEMDSYYLTFPTGGAADTSSVKLTLAWTDPAGSPPAYGLDNTTRMLVNDLDVLVTNMETGESFRPWVLDPANPGNSAGKGDNTRDNVEQVAAGLPFGAGATYLVTVSHKGTLSGTQAYSLVSSHKLTRNESWANVTPPALAGAISGGVWGTAWGDYDGDNDDDLCLTVGNGAAATFANRLLKNDGSGGVTDVASGASADAGDGRVGVWGDYDNDGDLDIFLANESPTDRLLRNDGSDSFSEMTNNPPVGSAIYGSSRSAAWADYDGDGDLDIFVVHRSHSSRLYRNDCSAGFVDTTTTPLGDYEVGRQYATWVDYDNDKDPDLYMTAGVWSSPVNRLFRNNGSGAFSEVNAYPATNTRSDAMAWGDYDNDGDLDLFLGRSPTLMSDQLLRNDGGGTFTDATPGVFSGNVDTQAAAWGDFDNDGRLDLFLVGGTFRHLRNLGSGSFSEVSSGMLASYGTGTTSGVSVADYDRDGDLDVLAHHYLYGSNKLLQNQLASSSSFLGVRLAGGSGGCGTSGRLASSGANAAAIGARVRVVAGGLAQIREVSGGAGNAQHSLAQHFGLGAATVVDTLQILWPGSGLVETMTNIPAGQDVIVEEGQGLVTEVALLSPSPATWLLPAAPNPFNPHTTVRFVLARSGPVRLAVYDVHGRQVNTLLDQAVSAGEHALSWQGQDGYGQPVASGIYFLQMEAGGYRERQKLLLVR